MLSQRDCGKHSTLLSGEHNILLPQTKHIWGQLFVFGCKNLHKTSSSWGYTVKVISDCFHWRDDTVKFSNYMAEDVYASFSILYMTNILTKTSKCAAKCCRPAAWNYKCGAGFTIYSCTYITTDIWLLQNLRTDRSQFRQHVKKNTELLIFQGIWAFFIKDCYVRKANCSPLSHEWVHAMCDDDEPSKDSED